MEDYRQKMAEVWRVCIQSRLGLDSYRDVPLDYVYLDRVNDEAGGKAKSSRWCSHAISGKADLLADANTERARRRGYFHLESGPYIENIIETRVTGTTLLRDPPAEDVTG
ncbi:uncharacterized protein ARMOST_16765 [Armillaria ostoyae]|uniref:Uncharacterized protein n=1 Tax=Armillaria ostoyae TaxID=47428 RepID=A0A284RX63_ARMOS|nr:uncharacterized protein ARMOST_16765 [Armillaria ostoyae]